jgi:hypothetical protein
MIIRDGNLTASLSLFFSPRSTVALSSILFGTPRA